MAAMAEIPGRAKKAIFPHETMDTEDDSEWKANDWCKEIHVLFAAEDLDNK